MYRYVMCMYTNCRRLTASCAANPRRRPAVVCTSRVDKHVCLGGCVNMFALHAWFYWLYGFDSVSSIVFNGMQTRIA